MISPNTNGFSGIAITPIRVTLKGVIGASLRSQDQRLEELTTEGFVASACELHYLRILRIVA